MKKCGKVKHIKKKNRKKKHVLVICGGEKIILSNFYVIEETRKENGIFQI